MVNSSYKIIYYNSLSIWERNGMTTIEFHCQTNSHAYKYSKTVVSQIWLYISEKQWNVEVFKQPAINSCI